MEQFSCCGCSGVVGRTTPLGRLVTGGTIGRVGNGGGSFCSALGGGCFSSALGCSALPAETVLSLATMLSKNFIKLFFLV